jgi:hypothetical protein
MALAVGFNIESWAELVQQKFTNKEIFLEKKGSELSGSNFFLNGD